MNVLEAIEKRRTRRKFLDLPIEWEKVGFIVMGGHYAPNAGNIQNWRFVVVTDKGKRKALAEACMKQYWMEEAAVHIVICSDPKEMKRHYDDRGELYDLQSAAAAAQNMLLVAEEEGLGAAWVGAFEEDMVRNALNMPDKVKPHAVLVFGYSEENPPMPEKYHISDITHINEFGNKIANLDLVLDEWSGVIAKKVAAAKEAAEKVSRGKGIEAYEKNKTNARNTKTKISKRIEDWKTKRKLDKIKKQHEKEMRMEAKKETARRN